MPVTGPAGIIAFYILSAIGFPGLFYRKKSPFLDESTELAKYMAVPLCSIAAFIVLKQLFQNLYLKSKPVFPAEQIVMDVKRMNINFTLLGGEKGSAKTGKKPLLLGRFATSPEPSRPSSIGLSFSPVENNHEDIQ